MSRDGEDQEDELLVLASIYEECFTTSKSHTEEEEEVEQVDGGGTSGELGGVLAIHLDLPPDFTLLTRLNNGTGDVREERYPVEHLPPINLHFTFPPTYPSLDPPCFTLSCKWLNRTQLTRLCQKLDSVWEENEGCVITFMWAQFLKEQAMEYLDLTDTLDLDTVRPTRTNASKPCDVATETKRKESDAGAGNEACDTPRTDVPDPRDVGTVREDGGEKTTSDTAHTDALNLISDVGREESRGEGDENPCDETRNLETDEGREDNVCDAARSETCDTSDSFSNSEGAVAGVKTSVNHENRYDARGIQDIGPKTNVLNLLRDYNEEMKRKVFEGKVFECKVCFMEKVGVNCLEFWPCRHVYCKECMASFFSVQISEGNIKFLKCPQEKCESEANPKQVQDVVPADLYNRWDQMLLNSTLSSLGDIQSCPRIHCQYPVTIEDGQGQCPLCKFVFCGICRFSWHGVEPCRLRDSEARKIMDLFINGTASEKKLLEDQYGKKYLCSLRDEYLSLTYLEENSKRCPKCRTKIEKIDGCNKMTCQRCSVYFCWLCMNILKAGNPYNHFSDRNSPCYNQLFQGAEEEDDWYYGDDDYFDDDDDDY